MEAKLVLLKPMLMNHHHWNIKLGEQIWVQNHTWRLGVYVQANILSNF
jgi:hypothetical protein